MPRSPSASSAVSSLVSDRRRVARRLTVSCVGLFVALCVTLAWPTTAPAGSRGCAAAEHPALAGDRRQPTQHHVGDKLGIVLARQSAALVMPEEEPVEHGEDRHRRRFQPNAVRTDYGAEIANRQRKAWPSIVAKSDAHRSRYPSLEMCESKRSQPKESAPRPVRIPIPVG